MNKVISSLVSFVLMFSMVPSMAFANTLSAGGVENLSPEVSEQQNEGIEAQDASDDIVLQVDGDEVTSLSDNANITVQDVGAYNVDVYTTSGAKTWVTFSFDVINNDTQYGFNFKSWVAHSSKSGGTENAATVTPTMTVTSSTGAKLTASPGNKSIPKGTKSKTINISNQTYTFSKETVDRTYVITCAYTWKATSTYKPSKQGASWTGKMGNYTVTYNKNGGNSQPANGVKWANSNYTVSGAISREEVNTSGSEYRIEYDSGNDAYCETQFDLSPLVTKYDFQGWRSSSDNVLYQPGSQYTKNQNTTMTAQWGNSKVEAQAVELPTVSPYEDNYVFLGWSEDPNETDENNLLPAGYSYIPSGDVTLYAIMKKVDYTVVFMGNGAEGGNAVADQGFDSDVAQKLHKNTFKKKGYEFVGWSKTRNSHEPEYTDEELVYDIPRNQGQRKIQLYAIWKKDINLNYDTKDPSTSFTDTKTIWNAETEATFQVKKTLATAPENYDFVGWSESNEDSKTGIVTQNDSYTLSEDKTVYACYDKSIIYNNNAKLGTISKGGDRVYYDNDEVVLPTVVANAPYEFDCFVDEDDYEIGGSGESAVVPSTARILTARYTVDPYSGTACAILADDGTLTFFRTTQEGLSDGRCTVEDIYGNERTGYLFWDIEHRSNYKDMFANVNPSVKKITFADRQKIRLTGSIAGMFANMKDLTSANLYGFDTSGVTSMAGLFDGDVNLRDLNLAGWETYNVEDMSNMFRNCRKLASLDLSDFDTSNVTNMSGMFSGLGADNTTPTDLNISGFNASNVTNSENMFKDANIGELDLDKLGFDPNNTTRSVIDGVNIGDQFSVGEKYAWLLEVIKQGLPEGRYWIFTPADGSMGGVVTTENISAPGKYERLTLDKVNLTLSDSEFTYDGSLKKPTAIVTYGALTFKEGEDYTSHITGGVSAGEYTATVSSMNDQRLAPKVSEGTDESGVAKATKSVNYVINPAYIGNLNIAIPETEYVYNGAEQKPVPTITADNGNVIPEDDYALYYENNIHHGIGLLKVSPTNTGNIVGDVNTTKFEISKRDASNANVVLKEKAVYNGEAKTPKFELVDGEFTLPAADYDSQYTNNVNAGQGTIVVGFSDDYSPRTAQYGFTIEPKEVEDCKITADKKDFVYSGKENKPSYKVEVNEVGLTEDDYTVSYKDNVNAGTGKVVVAFKNNYCGTCEDTFTINKKDISSEEMLLDTKEFTYDGLSKTPNVVSTLEKGKDYTVTYKNNVKAGLPVVVVTGQGNYNGIKQIAFTINKNNNPLINVSSKKTTAKKGKKTGVFFTNSVNSKLTYKLSGKNAKKFFQVKGDTLKVKKNAKPGKYTIKVKAKLKKDNANYKQKSKTFKIKVTVKK